MMSDCRLIDLGKIRNRIIELRTRGLGVAETALLMRVSPATVEKLAPAYVPAVEPSAIDALLERWERRRVRREARREARHQPLTWVSLGSLE